VIQQMLLALIIRIGQAIPGLPYVLLFYVTHFTSFIYIYIFLKFLIIIFCVFIRVPI
jgi:hypothetical protein